MRWRTRAGVIRALLLGCVGVILVVVVVRGFTHNTPVQPQTLPARAHLYASTANEGRSTLPANALPQRQARNSLASPRVSHLPSPIQMHAEPQSASATEQNPAAGSDMAARFPALAHQAITADPSGGTEAQYFLRLGNLVNGARLSPGTQIGPTADHLAQAQADLDHDDFAGAVAETERLSGPAARVMSEWLAEARSRVASRHAGSAPARLAQSAPQRHAWPNVMPTEIPPFARESSDPPPAP